MTHALNHPIAQARLRNPPFLGHSRHVQRNDRNLQVVKKETLLGKMQGHVSLFLTSTCLAELLHFPRGGLQSKKWNSHNKTKKAALGGERRSELTFKNQREED